MDTQPFDLYKDKVEYDYIISVAVKVEDMTNEVISSIIQLIKDEDFLAIYFKEVGLGRVYVKVDYMMNNKLQVVFGISLVDAKAKLTLQNLKKDIKDFIMDLNKNIENKDLNIKESDISMDIISESINVVDLDKQLVLEGSLTFSKGNNQIQMTLTDDGMIEHNINNELCETYPFARLKLIRECRKLIQDGYKLNENISENSILDNPQETKNELEQQIADIDEIQELKNELDDKIDNLIEEAVDKNISEVFPTTEFTSKPLAKTDELDLEHNLTNEQQDWILFNICDDILDFEKLLKDFITTLSINEEPIISINEFIKQLNTIIKTI